MNALYVRVVMSNPRLPNNIFFSVEFYLYSYNYLKEYADMPVFKK